MSDYRYKNPQAEGYVKFIVPVKTHKKFFPKSVTRRGSLIEYYYNPETETLKIQRFTKAWARVLLILLLFIPAIFMQGIPETIKDTKELFFERKYGKFVEDIVFMNYNDNADLEKLVKAEYSKRKVM